MADKGDSVEVTFEGDLEEKVQQFSRVLVSVGRRPNSAGLGLENTKVEVNEQGFVVVDSQQRTADPTILAIGDVAGEPMLAHKAAHEGKVAVEVLAGEPAQFAPRAIPAVVFTDPEIAWAGLTQNEAKAKEIEVTSCVFPWAASGRAQAVGRTEGFTKWAGRPEERSRRRLRNRRPRCRRPDRRGGSGHRDGRRRTGSYRFYPPAPDADGNPGRGGGSLPGNGNGPISSQAIAV